MMVNRAKIGLIILGLFVLFSAALGLSNFLKTRATRQPGSQNDNSVGAANGEAERKAVKEILPPSRAFSVHVTDGKGQPVVDAEVYFRLNNREYDQGQTDAEGRWSCLVPDDIENWHIFARKANVGFDYCVCSLLPGSSEEMEPLPDQIKLTLDGARSLGVKTVDHEGKPVAGVRVGVGNIRKPGRKLGIYLPDVSYSIWADALWPITNEDGIAVFDWLPKRFERDLPIRIHTEEYFARDSSMNLMADKPIEDLTIPLLPIEELSGRVTYADGRPVAGARIWAQGTGVFPSATSQASTDAVGRYVMRVWSEHAYIVVAHFGGRWASQYRADIVVRAGRSMEDVDLVLRPATRLRGRLTFAESGGPAYGIDLDLELKMGEVFSEPRRAKDREHNALRMNFYRKTDNDGRYEFSLAPGEYQLKTRPGTEVGKIKISANNPPAEIVRDLQVPRPETGPFSGVVLDEEERPVLGAIVEGHYASPTQSRFPKIKTGDQGWFVTERSFHPLVLRAQSPDNGRAGIGRIDAEAPRVKIIVKPVEKAFGRLLDLQGKSLAGKEVQYGIRVFAGESGKSPYSDCFGGTIASDTSGHFTLTGLIPGEAYHLSIRLSEGNWREVKQIILDSAKAIDIGELRIDTQQIRR
jgi:hypothetical protein